MLIIIAVIVALILGFVALATLKCQDDKIDELEERIKTIENAAEIAVYDKTPAETGTPEKERPTGAEGEE